MVLWKKNYGTLGKNMILYRIYGTLICYGKNYGTMAKKNYETIVNYSNYSLLLYFYARDSRIELEHALSNLKICLCHNNIICSYEKKKRKV